MQVETFIIILIAFLLGFRVILRYLYVHNGLQICLKWQLILNVPAYLHNWYKHNDKVAISFKLIIILNSYYRRIGLISVPSIDFKSRQHPNW